MIQTVLKRDGRVVGFNEEKIATAIRKAMLHTNKGEDLQLIHQITDRISFKGDSQMTVEAIQDLVSGADEEQPQGRCPEIHRLPQPAKHCPQSKDARHVPGNH